VELLGRRVSQAVGSRRARSAKQASGGDPPPEDACTPGRFGVESPVVELPAGELLVEKTETAWILGLRGEWDMGNSGTLNAELEAVFAHGTKVVVDLTDAALIDSSIVATLLKGQQHAATKADDGFVIVAPERSFALRLLRLVGYQQRLEVYPTRDEAVAALSDPQPAGQAPLVEQIVSAFQRRDSARLAELVHPDAVIEPRPSPQPLHGPSGVTRYIDSMRDRLAAVSVTSIHEIAEDVVLIEGREQWQAADNSMLDTPVVWVVRFRDGLIWRTRTYTDRREAVAGEADIPSPNSPR
jgi:anti-anti-sigma factor